MKRLSSLVILLALAPLAFSQISEIQRGYWTGGGHLGLSLKSNRFVVLDPPAGFVQPESDSYSKFSMGPWAAYFFLNGFAAGLDTKLRFENGIGAYGLGPLLYYYYALSTKAALFATASMFYLSQSLGSGNIQPSNYLSFGGGPGLALFLHTNIALTMALLWESESRKLDYFTGSGMYEARYTNSCFGLKVGFQKFFDCGRRTDLR